MASCSSFYHNGDPFGRQRLSYSEKAVRSIRAECYPDPAPNSRINHRERTRKVGLPSTSETEDNDGDFFLLDGDEPLILSREEYRLVMGLGGSQTDNQNPHPKRNHSSRWGGNSQKTPSTTHLSSPLRSSSPPRSSSSTRLPSSTRSTGDYEWQFQDDRGQWITYGRPSSSGDSSLIPTATSADIEKHYNEIQGDMYIKSRNQRYLLDFSNGFQINVQTNTKRKIRRNLKCPRSDSTPAIKHKWQFQDDFGAWITYGAPNPSGGYATVLTTTSDDIERHYSNTNLNGEPLYIRNGNHRYVLDFGDRLQVNLQSRTTRSIRRVAKKQDEVRYQWQFQDEHDMWITYGHPNLAGNHSLVPSTTSDNIEEHYLNYRDLVPMNIKSKSNRYEINFKSMKQINQNTHVQRCIRRVPKIVTKNIQYSNSQSADPITSLRSLPPEITKSLPSNWARMDDANSTWMKVKLRSSESEYRKRKAEIKQTMPNCHMHKLYRIQNPFLWKAYENRKAYLELKFTGIHFSEHYLYHGTDPGNVEAICEENIDWRLHGSKNGQSFGRGAYFSGSASGSASYASTRRFGYDTHNLHSGRSGPASVMFIVRVLIGQVATGNSSTVRPPTDRCGQPCDTTVNCVFNPSVFVKYDSNEYYPEYYVEFS